MKDKIIYISLLLIIICSFAFYFYLSTKLPQELFLSCETKFSDGSSGVRSYVINYSKNTIYDVQYEYYLDASFDPYKIKIDHSEKVMDVFTRIDKLTIDKITGKISGVESFETGKGKPITSIIDGTCTASPDLKI